MTFHINHYGPYHRPDSQELWVLRGQQNPRIYQDPSGMPIEFLEYAATFATEQIARCFQRAQYVPIRIR